ncbi:MAG TPA: hypothetical protein VGX23_34270 [Actinocrinis sp.]|nr:hypothetical protein [Actinocrinis sp.]
MFGKKKPAAAARPGANAPAPAVSAASAGGGSTAVRPGASAAAQVSVPTVADGPPCPNCGGASYDAGKIATYFNEFTYQAAGSPGRVSPAAITARRCRSCFNVQLFAPPKS